MGFVGEFCTSFSLKLCSVGNDFRVQRWHLLRHGDLLGHQWIVVVEIVQFVRIAQIYFQNISCRPIVWNVYNPEVVDFFLRQKSETGWVATLQSHINYIM